MWKNLRLSNDDERFLEGNLVRRNRHVDDLERKKGGGGYKSLKSHSVYISARWPLGCCGSSVTHVQDSCTFTGGKRLLSFGRHPDC